MAGNNELLEFGGTATNILTQSEYASDAQRNIGNQPGTARSPLVNKALRQSSFVAAAVGKMIAGVTNANVPDTGTNANDLAKLLATSMLVSGYAGQGGVANAYTLTLDPAPVSYIDGMVVKFVIDAANTGVATLDVNGLGPVPLVKPAGALAANDLTAGLPVVAIYVAGSFCIVSFLPNASGGLPVGSVIFAPGNTALPGTVKLNGALLDRATYAGLWTYAQASGNIEASDANWSTNRNANGSNGKFSPGDGSTTFRIPDVRGDFIRAWSDGSTVDSGRAIGSFQLDDFKSHTHSAPNGANSAGSVDGGALMGGSTGTTGAAGGTETRPRNTAWLLCMKF